jgi:hypothetical protein
MGREVLVQAPSLCSGPPHATVLLGHQIRPVAFEFFFYFSGMFQIAEN